jgi:hypothetical protein
MSAKISLLHYLFHKRSQDGAVGTATACGLNSLEVGFQSLVGKKNYHLSISSRLDLGPIHPSYQIDTGSSTHWSGE